MDTCLLCEEANQKPVSPPRSVLWSACHHTEKLWYMRRKSSWVPELTAKTPEELRFIPAAASSMPILPSFLVTISSFACYSNKPNRMPNILILLLLEAGWAILGQRPGKKIIFVLDWSLKWFWFCLSWRAEMPVSGNLVSYYLAFPLTQLSRNFMWGCDQNLSPVAHFFGEHQKNLSYGSLWCKYALSLIISTAICEPCVLSHCLNYISSCLQLMYTQMIPLQLDSYIWVPLVASQGLKVS